MIRQIIQMLIILLVGTKSANQPVHDLRKKPTKEDYLKTLDCTLQRYRWIFLALFFLVILITFMWVCFAVVGASVESGNYYYHLQRVV